MVPAVSNVSARLDFHSGREDEQDAKRGPAHGLLQIGIVKDDVGTLSTQFQGHVFEVALGGCLQDLAADECRTSEGDFFDLHVMGDGISNSVTVASENVDDTGRETSLVDKLGDPNGGQRCELGGLENNRVPCCKSGADFPGQHEHCPR